MYIILPKNNFSWRNIILYQGPNTRNLYLGNDHTNYKPHGRITTMCIVICVFYKDASDNRKFIKTKDEDFIVESLGGKAISGMFLGSNILLSQNIDV